MFNNETIPAMNITTERGGAVSIVTPQCNSKAGLLNMKKCFKCGIIKELSDYYKHPQMLDGHLNKCKDCTKRDTKLRADILMEDSDWYESEKKRHRDKYHRLGYKDKHKPTYEQKKKAMDTYKEKYPEKLLAKNKSQHLKPVVNGNHLHHWSYNIEHAKDIIELAPEVHATVHRYIVYDQERMMYRDAKSGLLLDTRIHHLNFLDRLNGII